MQIIVRQATPEDATALAQLAALTFPLACPPYHTAENIASHVTRVLSVDRFAEYASDVDFGLYTADMQGSLVGYSMVDYRPIEDDDVRLHLASMTPYAELSKLYVHPEFHGIGVAHTLLEEALVDMAGRGIRTAWLTVNQLNARANAFYEKHGFENVAEKQYLVGEVIDDDYLRIRALGDTVE